MLGLSSLSRSIKVIKQDSNILLFLKQQLNPKKCSFCFEHTNRTAGKGSRDDNWKPYFLFRLAFLTHITRQPSHTKGSDAHKMQEVSLALKLNVHVCIFYVVITYLLQCCSS